MPVFSYVQISHVHDNCGWVVFSEGVNCCLLAASSSRTLACRISTCCLSSRISSLQSSPAIATATPLDSVFSAVRVYVYWVDTPTVAFKLVIWSRATPQLTYMPYGGRLHNRVSYARVIYSISIARSIAIFLAHACGNSQPTSYMSNNHSVANKDAIFICVHPMTKETTRYHRATAVNNGCGKALTSGMLLS